MPANTQTGTAAPRTGRIGAIDAARGLALLAMASYHFTWDLEFFGYIEPGTATHGMWKLYARLIASSFLFLVGFSLVLAHWPQIRWRAFGRRLAMVAAAAAAITGATLVATPDSFIFFGILHSIAIGSLIGLAFLRLPPLVTALIAIAAIAAPAYLSSPLFDAPYLWWLGLSETLPRSNDYVPLLPWTGMLLLGVAVGRLVIGSTVAPRLAALPQGPRLLRLAGRHSLSFYLLHQPLLISLVFLASLVIPAPSRDPAVGYISSCESSCRDQGTDAAICVRFCSCTLSRLQDADLFALLQSGAILPEQNEAVMGIARECTAISQ